MLLYSISFLLGICSIQQLAVLPELSVFILLPIGVLLAIRYRLSRWSLSVRYICMALAGAFWATLSAHDYLDSRLAEPLAGEDIIITGKVLDIPTVKGSVQRFVFDVSEFTSQDAGRRDVISAYSHLPERLRLSWYYSKVLVKSGETWQFLVRLKPPHGLSNPAGFDYEAWLYQQGIHATGYVRKSELNQRLKSEHLLSVDALRQSLHQKINQHLNDSNYRGLISALAVGNRSLISSQQWKDLIQTGTNHLMAISGLHIGLAAAFGYWICRRSLPAAVMKIISAQQISICVGVIFALFYALLAGLSIPTQRALIMLFCVAGALVLKRHFDPANVLSLALLLVLLIDPVSVLSAGFWFSFLAVAAIFYLLAKKPSFDVKQSKTENEKYRLLKLTGYTLWQWSRLQLVIASVLFPLSLLMFQQGSLISPIANFVLVPFVSFLVVPLILLALLFFVIYQPVALWLVALADSLLEFIWPFLHFLSGLPVSHWVHNVSGIGVTVLAMTGIAMMLSKFNWRYRSTGIFLVFPLFITSPNQLLDGEFDMFLLDVGQGLSVIIQTQNHLMVYDAGARFSDEMDSGQAVVLPMLRTLGTHRLDKLMISHGDNDHIGGAQSIVDAYPFTQVIGQDIESLDALNKTRCKKGDNWIWDGVQFEVLHPEVAIDNKRNNRSCVLKVTGPGGSLLLTGDIEKKIEKRLINTSLDRLESDVLLVPHHGSKTSSSIQWLKAVNPSMALFATGYRNRYRLPSKDIVLRYSAISEDKDTILLNTASSGAIKLNFHPDQGVVLKEQYRIDLSKYWNHQSPQF